MEYHERGRSGRGRGRGFGFGQKSNYQKQREFYGNRGVPQEANQWEVEASRDSAAGCFRGGEESRFSRSHQTTSRDHNMRSEYANNEDRYPRTDSHWDRNTSDQENTRFSDRTSTRGNNQHTSSRGSRSRQQANEWEEPLNERGQNGNRDFRNRRDELNNDSYRQRDESQFDYSLPWNNERYRNAEDYNERPNFDRNGFGNQYRDTPVNNRDDREHRGRYNDNYANGSTSNWNRNDSYHNGSWHSNRSVESYRHQNDDRSFVNHNNMRNSGSSYFESNHQDFRSASRDNNRDETSDSDYANVLQSRNHRAHGTSLDETTYNDREENLDQRRRTANNHGGYGQSPYNAANDRRRYNLRRYETTYEGDETSMNDPYLDKKPADVPFFNATMTGNHQKSKHRDRRNRRSNPHNIRNDVCMQESHSNTKITSAESLTAQTSAEHNLSYDEMAPHQPNNTHGNNRGGKKNSRGGKQQFVANATPPVDNTPKQASSSAPFPQSSEIPSPVAVVAPKKEPATRVGKEKVKLVTNFFPLEISSHVVYRYDVNVRLKRDAGAKDIDLTKGARDDAAVVERKRMCLAAMKTALEMYRIIREGEAVIQDGVAIMFSSDNLEAALKPHSHTLTLAVSDLPKDVRAHIRSADVSSIEIEIVPCREGADHFDIADYEKAQSNRDFANIDRSFKQFFDMLTNQDAIADGRYTQYGAGKLFSSDIHSRKSNKNGQELVQGCDKGIKFISGRKSGPSRNVAALVLDAKVGNFYKEQSLKISIEERMRNIPGAQRNGRFPFEKDHTHKDRMNSVFNEVNKYVKGLRLTFINTLSNIQSSFVATGISRIPVSLIQETDITGAQQLLMSRFPNESAHSINVNWPAVVFRSFDVLTQTSRDLHYPMELLMVAPNQRVSFQKQIEPPATAVKPDIRFREIARLLNSLNLDAGGSRNHFLRAFGVSISTMPLEVEGIRRQRPSIMYGGKNAKLDLSRSNWAMERGDKYTKCGTVDHIIFAHSCNQKVADEAKRSILMMMKDRGILVSSSDLKHIQPNEFTQLQAVFDHAQKQSVNKKLMIIFIDALNNKSHGWLKLFERKFSIITQQISTELAEKLFRSRASCSNVVNKINMKLGGLNHGVVPESFGQNHWISTGKTLIIGYDVAHPGKPDRDELLNKKPPPMPSIVGFSFNGGAQPEQFIGDFHAQEPRMEQVSDRVLNVRIKWMLAKFIKHRKHFPENIFIVRDGVSEGQYRMVMEDELGAIKDACAEYGNLNDKPNWCPKFLVVIVTKRHNARMATFNGKEYHNPLPGTVIDTDIVRNDMTEFLMQSHRVIQGTGKSPTYQILVDDLNMTSDEVQATMMALAFTHQIVESPISLPEPVYQADEWAKRGTEMWKAFDERFKVRLAKDKGNYASCPIDYEVMTNLLAYWKTPLEEARINA